MKHIVIKAIVSLKEPASHRYEHQDVVSKLAPTTIDNAPSTINYELLLCLENRQENDSVDRLIICYRLLRWKYIHRGPVILVTHAVGGKVEKQKHCLLSAHFGIKSH